MAHVAGPALNAFATFVLSCITPCARTGITSCEKDLRSMLVYARMGVRGRMAQRERNCLTSSGSGVQIPLRPPEFSQVTGHFARWPVSFCRTADFYHRARRASMARPRVTSSANSKSPPTGRPLARRVTEMPSGLIKRAK